MMLVLTPLRATVKIISPSDASPTTAVNASHTSWFGGIIGDSLFLLFATEQTPKRCSYVAAVDPKENKQLP
jgi:hypothetical protein